MARVSIGYSARQIGLHWLVFLLVAYQWFTGDFMTDLFRAAHGGRPADVSTPDGGPLHLAVGVFVLVLMVWRLALRHTVGAPPPARQHPALQYLASAVHVGLYLDLVLGALVGLAAYLCVAPARRPASSDDAARPARLFALHVVGALWHRFVVRDDVVTRIIRPAR